MAHKTPAKRNQDLDVQSELAFDGKVSEISYVPRANISFERWMEVGVTFGRIARSIQFWVGDWIQFGEDRFGERFAQALDGTGRDPKTLLEWARVCKAVPSDRRVKELSFAHHEAVSALDSDEQRFWLQRCLEGDKLPNGEVEVWSSKRLRAEIRGVGAQDDEAELEVEIVDKARVPLEYMVLDLEAVRAAYKAGKTEIAGLKLVPAEDRDAAVQKL